MSPAYHYLAEVLFRCEQAMTNDKLEDDNGRYLYITVGHLRLSLSF